MSTTAAATATGIESANIDVEQTVRECANYPHNRVDEVKRKALVLHLIGEGYSRSEADSLLPEGKWFSVQEPEPEPTEDYTEPLDNAPDHYGYKSPIASNTSLIENDDYINGDGSVQTLEQAIETYVGARRGEHTSAKKHGFADTHHSRAKGRYWKLLEGDRQLLQEYEQPIIGFLSLRLSPDTWQRGNLMDSLTATWNEDYGVYEKLRYDLGQSTSGPQLSSDSYSIAYVIAGTENGRGTPHLHVLVYADQEQAACEIDESTFEDSVEKWVADCEYAAESGHETTSNTIRVEGNYPVSEEEKSIPMATQYSAENSRVALYVASQIPHLCNPTDDSKSWPDQSELIHGAICHATQTVGFGTSESWPAEIGNYPVSEEEKPIFDIGLDLG